MIGLEFVLSIYQIDKTELAGRLGITKQQVCSWFSEGTNAKQIPLKHLLTLSDLFGLDRDCFQKEITITDEKRKAMLRIAFETE